MTVNEAKERVVKAAVAWVRFEDDGRVAGLAKLTKLQLRLGSSVTAYERALNRATQRRKLRRTSTTTDRHENRSDKR